MRRNCKCAGARFQLRHRKPETMVAMNMMILTYRIQTYLISNQVMIICKNYTVGIIYHRLYLPDLVYLNKYYGFQEASLQKSSWINFPIRSRSGSWCYLTSIKDNWNLNTKIFIITQSWILWVISPKKKKTSLVCQWQETIFGTINENKVNIWDSG